MAVISSSTMEVSKASAHRRLNITHYNNRLHGRLPRMNIAYVCMEAATLTPGNSVQKPVLVRDTIVKQAQGYASHFMNNSYLLMRQKGGLAKT